MNISLVSNCNLSFKSGNPPIQYRVRPFVDKGNNVELQMCADEPSEEKPSIAFYDKEGNLLGPLNAKYYYPMPARENTNYTLVTSDGRTNYTCYGEMMMDNATDAIRLKHNLPAIMGAKEGKVIGQIITGISTNLPHGLDKITKPTIIITNDQLIYGIDNPNVVGILAYPESAGGFSHINSLLHNLTDMFGIVVNPANIHELEKLNGKNVELELKDGNLYFKETEEEGKPRDVSPIKVPQLKYCDRVLSSEECTPDVIGGKAVNLHRLEVMAKEGKIDAIIPKFMALPPGYLKEFNIDEWAQACQRGDDETSEKISDNFHKYYVREGKLAELLDILKANGIGKNGLMVRSCFNDEDRPNLSNAGVYYSFALPAKYLDVPGLYDCISQVVGSKYTQSGNSIRKYYGIPDKDVQPGVVLQDRISTHNYFTIYTDDGNGNLKIDFRTIATEQKDPILCPHIYTYNKETGKLTYQTKQVKRRVGANFDEKCRLIYSDPVEVDLTGDNEWNARLKKAIDNALAVEKEFGRPQDIEGGFDDEGILYFWQSRKIVGLN